MKGILSIDHRGELSDKLAAFGLPVTPMKVPLTPEKMKVLLPLKAETVLAPSLHDDFPLYAAQLSELCSVSRVIVYGTDITREKKDILLKYNLPEVVESSDPLDLSRYITTSSMKSRKKGKGIILYETEPGPLRMIEYISFLMGYEVILVTTSDDFIDAVNRKSGELALVNISAKKIDLNKLICETYNNSDLVKLPVIAYGSLDHSIISDFLAGLNRLTRVVLNHEELYSYLPDMLFRSAMYPIIKHIKELSGISDTVFNTGDTLSNYYWNNQENHFEFTGLMGSENIALLMSSVESMQNLLVRAQGVNWLRKEKKPISLKDDLDLYPPFSFR
jgi:hypothetical protein